MFESGGINKSLMDEDEEMTNLMTLDSTKINMLLKYGAYAILEHDEREQKEYTEEDIDKILTTSRILKYENGESSENKGTGIVLSKASFKMKNDDGAEEEVDIDDSKFWDKVLGPRLIDKLTKQLQDV